MSAASLEERIAGAFLDGVTSTEVAELIQEAEVASVSSGEAAEQSRARALDPAISSAEVAKARRAMDDAHHAQSFAVPPLNTPPGAPVPSATGRALCGGG